MSAVRFQIVNEIVRILREEISFQPDPLDPNARAIQPASIRIRKNVRPRGMDKGYAADGNYPMIRLTFPYQEPFPEDLGTNEEDQYDYRFMAQIVDSDNFQPESNIATYFLWQEQICRNFQFRDLTQSGNISGASRTLATATSVQVVDESMWLQEGNFVAGVSFLVRTWMTRTWYP